MKTLGIKVLRETIRAYTEIIEDLLDDIVEEPKEEPKEKFITVTDGWRGSLKLKECWVRDLGGWAIVRDVEVISRCDEALGRDAFVYYNHEKLVCFAKELKFHPFSPENFPPTDWPIELPDGSARYCSGKYQDREICAFVEGRTSLSNKTGKASSWDKFKFLNIEPVDE